MWLFKVIVDINTFKISYATLKINDYMVGHERWQVRKSEVWRQIMRVYKKLDALPFRYLNQMLK